MSTLALLEVADKVRPVGWYWQLNAPIAAFVVGGCALSWRLAIALTGSAAAWLAFNAFFLWASPLRPDVVRELGGAWYVGVLAAYASPVVLSSSALGLRRWRSRRAGSSTRGPSDDRPASGSGARPGADGPV